MKKERIYCSFCLLIFLSAFHSAASANPILLKVGEYAATELTDYALDSALQALAGQSPKTYYHLEEDYRHFVLDFHSGFNGDVSSVVLSFDRSWYFDLTVNAFDYWGLSYAAVDNITFDGRAYHKKETIHDHPIKGDTVTFAYNSPSGSELIFDTSGLDEYYFPNATIAGKHNVSGSRIWWGVPLGSVNHDGHRDVYTDAVFSVFTDTRANGDPEDDILSWSFHLEGTHVPVSPTLFSLLAGLVVIWAMNIKIRFKSMRIA